MKSNRVINSKRGRAWLLRLVVAGFRGVKGCESCLAYPAINRNLGSICKCRNRAKSMVAVKYLEALERAEKDYRLWEVSVSSNESATVHPSLPRPVRNLKPSSLTVVMKRHHLLNAFLSLWVESWVAERKNPPFPRQLMNIFETEAAKVMGPLAKDWGLKRVKWPARYLDNFRNPHIEYLRGHIGEKLSRLLNLRRSNHIFSHNVRSLAPEKESEARSGG